MNRQLVGLLVVTTALAVAVAAVPKKTSHRVVFDAASGEESWDAILNNVENLHQAFASDGAKLELVAHGKALGMLLKDAKQAPRVAALAKEGVVFAACENAMRRQNVSRDALNRAAITVPAGIAELVKKQEAGWSYIKVGG